MTLQQLINNNTLTELETKGVTGLGKLLKPYFGEDYTDVEIADVAGECGWDFPTTKGVVGSLVKKGIVKTFNTKEVGWEGKSTELIYFSEQEDLT